MKNLNLFKMLAVLIVLITSINTAWAWSGLHLRSGSYYGGWYYVSDQFTYGDEANKYWDLAHTGGTFYWRLRTDYFGHDVGPYKNNQVMNVGTTGYKVVNTGDNAFKTTANAGIIRIQTSQNHDGASDEFPNVWITRPTVKFKYDFNNDGEASWEMVDATDNNDGTYTYKGLYCGTDFFCAGPNDGDKKAHSSNPTDVIGSPKSGQRCEFKWNCSDYKYVGNEDQNCGMFYITKLDSIIYDANGATKGSVPAIQEFVHGGSATLATNSGSLERVGYKFAGWYTNSTGTSGTGYDEGESVSLATTTTLYAKWEAADKWSINGGKVYGDGDDVMGNWDTYNYFTYSSEHALVWIVNLPADQKYQFKIVKTDKDSKADTWYGNGDSDGASKITETTTAEWVSDGNWTFEDGKKNAQLETTTAGTYVFTIDATTDGYPRLRVYFPGDAPKVFLSKDKYIYLNGTAGVWQGAEYKARFWFKATTEDVHTSNIECLYDNDLDVNYMYYTKVPSNDYIDRVQINRINPENTTYYSQVKHGYTRSNAGQNCVSLDASGNWGDGSSNWAVLNWDTYCPPMSSATIAHNDGEHTTAIYGGDGSDENPYLVATSSSIYVSATSESKLDDDNMTPYYQFKKAGDNDGDESSSATHTYTAHATNGTKEAMTVVARNYYYTTDAFYGTASPTSNSIYYESRTPYSVDVSGLNHMTVASGRIGSAAIVHGVEYVATLDSTVGYNRPTSVTVTCAGSDISANCTWVKASGVLTIPAAYVTGNIAITATGVAKTYTTSDNLKNPDNTTAGTYQVTYDATSIEFVGDAPTKTGYDIEGFYATNAAGVLSDKIANGDRSLVSSTTYTSGGKWNYDDGAPTLYINWTAHEYSITYKDKGDETFTGNNSGSLPTTHTYSSPTELVNATKTGYRFDGWYADAACTSRVYSLGATTYTDDITLYAKWILIVSSDNTNFDGYTTPSTYNDVLVTNGATLTISTSKTVQDITVETGSTLNVAKGASGITFTVNSLSLVGGWGTVGEDTKYDMPRVYIDPASTLYKAVSTVNLDVAIDNDNYYPIAVPFPVDVKDVDYADVYLAGLSTYGFAGQYAIKKYNGQQRADRGSNYANWEIMNDGVAVGYGSGTETLEPGHGYIITALPTTYETYATIRFPMTVENAWTAGGEKGSATISAVTITKNEVDVFDYKKAEGETPKNNKGWNLLGVPFMSCYATDEFAADPNDSYIKGKLDFSTGKYTDEENVYVSVPTHDFSEYVQSTIDEAVLLPGWCFFVQFDEEGTLTFADAGQAASSSLPIYAPKREQENMPTVKTGIILSSADASDKTTILVSDRYSAIEYEINADLEKLFGENSYTLATYSLSGETRLAYNAMSNADATQMIPIGYRAPEAGEYTFSINPRYADGAFGSVNLIDYETNTVTDLLQSSYTFSTERTQNDARFALNVVLANEVATAIENNGSTENSGARKIVLNGKLYIILNGQMYDATGMLVK